MDKPEDLTLHRDALNAIARRHGMPELDHMMHPDHYMGRAINLMCVELGLMLPDGTPIHKGPLPPGWPTPGSGSS